MSQALTVDRPFQVTQRHRGRQEFHEPDPPVRDSVPRVAKLMALAIRFDQLIRVGDVADYAELARLGRVSRARVSQIINLLNLAPDIQEELLFLPSRRRITERMVRPIVIHVDWGRQRKMWRALVPTSVV